MNSKALTILVSFFVLLFFLANSFFVLDQVNQAVVLRFGKVSAVYSDPGLKFKMPFVDQVKFFDNRLLDLNASPREVIAGDQKRLIVDAFAKFVISDPLKFYQSVRNEEGVRNRLNSILESSLRQVLGEYPLSSLLIEGKRVQIMDEIQGVVNNQVKVFGVTIKDVRIMRADLPSNNSNAIFRRMETEREREAKEIRAKGFELEQKIKAKADRMKVELLSAARKESEIVKGTAEAEVANLYVKMLANDKQREDFFMFYKSLESYKNIFEEMNLAEDNKAIRKFILSYKNNFFDAISK